MAHSDTHMLLQMIMMRLRKSLIDLKWKNLLNLLHLKISEVYFKPSKRTTFADSEFTLHLSLKTKSSVLTSTSSSQSNLTETLSSLVLVEEDQDEEFASLECQIGLLSLSHLSMKHLDTHENISSTSRETTFFDPISSSNSLRPHFNRESET